jgi:RsiW-degrading membrane proteinase PrsW (M82 family)
MASFLNNHALFYALLGGFIPPLLWLWFWLQEDRKRPEPKRVITLTFVSGMAAVPIAIFFEQLTQTLFPALAHSVLLKVLLWAFIEESLKLIAVLIGAFRTKDFDEPIDAVIYMITAALGFAALENVLFLFGVLNTSGFFQGFTTGDSRFLGATLLHAISSSLVGIAIGYTFYKSKSFRIVAIIMGLITATTLHGAFNFFIIQGEGKNIMEVFFILWMITILTMVVFEKVRGTKPE